MKHIATLSLLVALLFGCGADPILASRDTSSLVPAQLCVIGTPFNGMNQPWSWSAYATWSDGRPVTMARDTTACRDLGTVRDTSRLRSGALIRRGNVSRAYLVLGRDTIDMTEQALAGTW